MKKMRIAKKKKTVKKRNKQINQSKYFIKNFQAQKLKGQKVIQILLLMGVYVK